MILTPAQKATMQRGIAAANELLLNVEFIQGLAHVMPALQERAQELRANRDYLAQLCETALDLDQKLSAQMKKG